jgi:hypothetical protein
MDGGAGSSNVLEQRSARRTVSWLNEADRWNEGAPR